MTHDSGISDRAPTTPAEQLAWCLQNLGARVTSAVVESDPQHPNVTAALLDAGVAESVATKVALLFDSAWRVTTVYDEQTAQAFLRSSNPYAGDDSLLRVIASGDPEASAIIAGAVDQFLG